MPSDVIAGERRPEMYLAHVHIYVAAELSVGWPLCRSFTSEKTVLKFHAESIYYAQKSVKTLFLGKLNFGHVVTEFYRIRQNIYVLKS